MKWLITLSLVPLLLITPSAQAQGSVTFTVENIDLATNQATYRISGLPEGYYWYAQFEIEPGNYDSILNCGATPGAFEVTCEYYGDGNYRAGYFEDGVYNDEFTSPVNVRAPAQDDPTATIEPTDTPIPTIALPTRTPTATVGATLQPTHTLEPDQTPTIGAASPSATPTGVSGWQYVIMVTPTPAGTPTPTGTPIPTVVLEWTEIVSTTRYVASEQVQAWQLNSPTSQLFIAAAAVVMVFGTLAFVRTLVTGGSPD